jgi:wyosine [tRNA(Phe)-imidazoG37] synthetase (radical SAM superfamily)
MSAARNLQTPQGNFLDHPSTHGGIIYGPFENGPMKLNLGVNILGTGPKACSFNCAYCDLGETSMRLNKLKSEVPFASIESVTMAINQAFQKIHSQGPAVDGICISGNGEPTLHPEFPEIAKLVLSARDIWMPGKPVSVFTNGAALDTRRVAEAMNLVDHRIVKIDAGNEKLFKLVNSPLSRTNLAKVLAGTRKLKDVIVQSLFFQGEVSNISTSDIDDWIEVIAVLKPKAVHIYGLSRPSAVKGLLRLDEDTIYSIASRLERKTQIKAIVTP